MPFLHANVLQGVREQTVGGTELVQKFMTFLLCFMHNQIKECADKVELVGKKGGGGGEKKEKPAAKAPPPVEAPAKPSGLSKKAAPAKVYGYLIIFVCYFCYCC